MRGFLQGAYLKVGRQSYTYELIRRHLSATLGGMECTFIKIQS